MAHKHDSIVAEENHHLQPQSRGGKTVKANMRYLCANAHSDTHYLLDLIEDNAATLVGESIDRMEPYEMIPYAIRRTYGPGVRDAALTGWLLYADDFLAGKWAKHAALWTSAGQPRQGATRKLGARSMVGVGVLALPYAHAVAGTNDLDWIVRQVEL